MGEIIAKFGLLLVIQLTSRFRGGAVPIAVACFITSACWFTSSTSLANPAVTLAHSTTGAFAGIAPGSVLLFPGARAAGAIAAVALGRWLVRRC